MKVLLGLALLALSGGVASAQYLGYGTGSNPNSHVVRPYVTDRGTVVQGYRATNPNSTQRDNYGTIGNVNPYTSTYGTQIPRR